MIGIVVVSHSPALATAAVDLALQMGAGTPPQVEIAAGAGEGVIGTDATAIAEAIQRADSGDGVLVVMDLGSALLSTEMALEFLPGEVRVALSPAPFVEGLVSAVSVAAGGAALEEVAAELRRVADAKLAQLGEQGASPADSGPSDTDGQGAAFEGVVKNPSGLHARPAAVFARSAGSFEADVQVANLDTGGPSVNGSSMISLMALGIRPGSRIRITATGPRAQEAVQELGRLVEDGFGEL